MADEAFALSPSPASASDAAPAIAEYDAILSAFMETTRGRWFLNEYTRRNRNADTAMVLAAVARIEHGIAAHRVPAAPDMDERLEAINAIVDECRAGLAAAGAEPVPAEALAPLRRSARILEEIAWGLRESGADGRICTLLDDQVRAINGACDGFAGPDSYHAALAAIDAAIARIGRIANGDELSDALPSEDAAPEDDTSNNSVAEDDAPAADTALLNEAAQESEDTQSETAQETEPAISSSAPPPADRIAAPPTASAYPPSPETSLEFSPETSLGASLIAQGIVAAPQAVPPDPLMPIRRMSHAERIAFFS